MKKRKASISLTDLEDLLYSEVLAIDPDDIPGIMVFIYEETGHKVPKRLLEDTSDEEE